MEIIGYLTLLFCRAIILRSNFMKPCLKAWVKNVKNHENK